MASAARGGTGRALRVVLTVHGVVTIAAAVVLAVLPAAIPATVGIALEPDAYLLSYFLAAAELAIGLLSLGAVTLTDTRSLRLIVGAFVVFHAATAVLELVYSVNAGMSPVLAANILIRVVASIAFVVTGRTLRPG
jgi:hypothetical protein